MNQDGIPVDGNFHVITLLGDVNAIGPATRKVSISDNGEGLIYMIRFECQIAMFHLIRIRWRGEECDMRRSKFSNKATIQLDEIKMSSFERQFNNILLVIRYETLLGCGASN